MTSTATRSRTAVRPALAPAGDPATRFTVGAVSPLTEAQRELAAALADDRPVRIRPAGRPAPAAPPQPRRTGTRITRRGRLVVLVAIAMLLLVATSIGRVSLDAATDAEAPLPTRQITVHEGDTLWTIAARVAPQADRREAIEQLRRLNDLSGSGLVVGQALTVPA